MAARTPLYDRHIALGARMTEFGGWEMPLEYSGGVAEHVAVRSAAGLFDTSHMGRIRLTGPRSAEFLDSMVTCRLSDLGPGRMRYGFLCDERGGVVDDLTVYRMGEREFVVVVNAATAGGDLEWLWGRMPGDGVVVTDETAITAKLDLQGPRAGEALAAATDIDWGSLKYWRFAKGRVCGAEALVSRSGYTGEYGFEIYVPSAEVVRVWDGLLDAGRAAGVEPCGLASRDTLRIEACLPLYGHELSRERTPYEAGLGRSVDADKAGLVGGEALRARRDSGPTEVLAAFVSDGRAPLREGSEVRRGGRKVGTVSSGTFCPSMNASCGMAFVKKESSAPGTALAVVRRGQEHAVRVVEKPIYTKGSTRR